MKNFYIVVTIEENGKYYPYMIKTNSSNNLLSTLKIPDIINATLFETKKRAAETVETWRTAYKANGTYLFD